EAVPMLRAAGVQQLSLDLMWGVPGQSVDDVRRDIDAALELGCDHLSAYELELKPGTRLAHRFPADPATHGTAALGEAGDEFYDLVIDRVEAAGWRWYETANFARTDHHRCRHNLVYWRAQPWIGIGVGAVGIQNIGTESMERRTNLPNLPR